MSISDLKLVKKVFELNTTNYHIALGLMDETESPKTKDIIFDRYKYLYHKEEALEGMI